MTKKALILVAGCLLLIIASLPGCYGAIRGSGTIVTRTFQNTDFTRLEAGNAFQVEVVGGSSYSISVTADDNMFDYIRVSETDETLLITMRPGYTYFPSALIARVVTPDLEALSVYSASRVEVSGFDLNHPFEAEVVGASAVDFSNFTTGDMQMTAGTASQIKGAIDCDDLEMEASGASRINIDGLANYLHLTGSGASNIDLAGLEAQDAVVGLSGASSAVVNLSGRLDAGLTGASHLKYLGQPVLGNINLSDFSTVDPG